MCDGIQRYLLRFILSRVQAKLAPDMIGFNPEIDCYAAYFSLYGRPDARFMFQSLDGDKVSCRAWDENRFSRPELVGIGDIDHKQLEIFHWYRQITCKTQNAWSFFCQQLFFIAHLRNAIEQLSQSRYNRSFRLRSDRQELLRLIYERSIFLSKQHKRIDPSFSQPALAWFFDIHGTRAAQHPNFNENILRFNALIKSLISSGDLVEENHKLSFSGNALNSLATFELEERRHRDQLNTNKAIAALTLVLVIIGAINLFS